MLHKAAEAGRRNNTKGVYDVVRRLVPKALASVSKFETFMVFFFLPLQELEELRSYYHEMFQQHPPLEEEAPA